MIIMNRGSKGIFMTAFRTASARMTNAAEEAGQRLMEEIKWERPNSKPTRMTVSAEKSRRSSKETVKTERATVCFSQIILRVWNRRSWRVMWRRHMGRKQNMMAGLPPDFQSGYSAAAHCLQSSNICTLCRSQSHFHIMPNSWCVGK